jgi:hypothetical protein
MSVGRPREQQLAEAEASDEHPGLVDLAARAHLTHSIGSPA